MVQDSCSPNTWLHPWTSPGHSEPIIKNLVYKPGSYLNRHTYTSSASSSLFPASSSTTQHHSPSSSFITGCWTGPIPCPAIVRHSNCVCIYLPAYGSCCTSELLTFPFVRKSQRVICSSVHLSLNGQVRKVSWKRLIYYGNLFSHLKTFTMSYCLTIQ